jgi:hypothetical protein
MTTVYLCAYTLDGGTQVNIELDQPRASAGSFGAGSGFLGPPHEINGNKFLKVRGVYGRAGTKRMFLPCATQAALTAIYNAGTFTVLPYAPFVVTGFRGEHQTQTTPLP